MSTILHTEERKIALSRKTVVLRAMGTLLCLMIGGAVMAQPIYFDALYDGPSVTENMFNVLPHENGYVFATVSQDLFADTGAVVLVFIDGTGSELSRTVYEPEGRNFNAGKLVSHSDSGYVYLHSITDTVDGSKNFHLIRYEANGSVSFTKEYVKDGNDICFWGIQCSDGGFALCGQGGSFNGVLPETMLIRTDNLGNELWRQFYGGSAYEGGADLVETPDGGFLLLGWTRSFGAVQKDFYLVKTDSQGNEDWYKRYGENGNEGGQDILETADGNYVLSGGGSYDGVTSHGRLYKVNPSGDVIWTENYIMQNGNSLFHTIELLDGSLVSTGLTTTSFESNAGWLIKTDSDGALIWQRKYNKNDQIDLFYGVLATEDGGFLLSGQAINEDNITQDAWLLKVDSVGCTYPNCITGIDELGSKDVMVDVWPNPVSDVLNIELVGFSLREHFDKLSIAPQGRASLEMTVVDLSGKEIWSTAALHPSSASGFAIDVSAWASGMYVLKGTDDKGRAFSVKVVKE